MKTRFGLFLLSLLTVLSCTREPDTVAVTNVTLNASSIDLVEGDTFSLEATVSPSNATNPAVIWSSGNATVATVDNKGTVTARAPGNTTVTVTSDDGGKTASCRVTVAARVIHVTGVSLSKPSLALRVGDQTTLEATVSPADATDKSVTWFSSNERVATVSTSGKVFAVGAGTAVISVKTVDGGFEAECQTVVTVAVSGITLNPDKLTLDEGETRTVSAVVTPADATDQTVSWESSDPSVATVDGGRITGVKAGVAVVTAQTQDGGKTASCTVTVIAHARSVSLDQTSLNLEKGENATLVATVLPENTTDKSLQWTSTNPAVATVSADGTVSAVGAGQATIVVKTVDGGLQAECAVTVVISVSSLTLTPSSLQLKAGESGTLSVSIDPEDATEREITWKSSAPSIATVKDGVVTAVKSGSARITATAPNGVSATCEVTVIVPVTGVTVSPQVLTLEQYTSARISVSVAPSGATDKRVTWSSSDPSVARVSDGLVEGLTPGTAEITATTVDGGFTATCAVTVEKEKTKATSLSFPAPSLYVGYGHEYALKVDVQPEDAVGNFTWRSSNSGNVTVSGSGNTATVRSTNAVTGYTTVTVTDQRTGLSASIKVYSFIQNFTWNESSSETYSGYPLITIPVGGTHQLKYTSSAGSNVLNLFGNLDEFVFYEPTYVVSAPTNISISPEGLVTGLKEGRTGLKSGGFISGNSDRVYFRVASKIYESEYNDSKDYANNVPYGMPIEFRLSNTSDVDWFKLQTNTTTGYNIPMTLTVDYPAAANLDDNVHRSCKYSLYDSNMQQWNAGTFDFSKSAPTLTIKKLLPAGPLYLKVYFDTSHPSVLLPEDYMTVKITVD